jgi:hypothetical protein
MHPYPYRVGTARRMVIMVIKPRPLETRLPSTKVFS